MADAGGFDLSAIGPGLVQAMPGILAALASGQNPMGSGGYSPRSATFGGNAGMFSMTQMMSQFGPLLSGLGLPADIFGATQFPQLWSRLQANAGGDPLQMAQQRATMQTIMETQYKGSALAEAKALFGAKFDPNNAGQQAFMAASPILNQLIPGMQNLAYLTTPTAMFTGGQAVAATLQMMDRTSQIRPGQATAMREAMYRLGTNGNFMNSTFTHGMNMDQLADASEFTADMGTTATDLDIGAIREASRARRRKERGSVSGLFEGVSDALIEVGVTQDVMAEKQLHAASYNAQVGQAVKSLLGPEATSAQAFQYMAQHGISAQNQDQASVLEGVIRNLEALGKQAGMTTQQIMNAGSLMAAQSGGSQIYNELAAASAGATERYMTLDARDKGLKTNPLMDDVIKNRIMQGDIDYQGGTTNKSLIAFSQSNDANRKTYLDLVANGDVKGLMAISNEVDYGSSDRGRQASTLMNASDAQFAAWQASNVEATGKKSLSMDRKVRLQMARDRIGSYRSQFGDLVDSDAVMDELALGQKTGTSPAQIALNHGKSMAEATAFSNFIMNDRVGQNLLTAAESQYADARVQSDAAAQATRATLIQRTNEITKTQGAGQGLFQNWKAGNITGKTLEEKAASALVAAGYAQPGNVGRLVSLTAGMGEKDLQSLVDNIQAKGDAIVQLGNGNLDESAKQNAEDKLLKAQDNLSAAGYDEMGTGPGAETARSWLQEARTRAAAAQKDGAGADTAAAKKDLPKPPDASTAGGGAAAGATKLDVSGAVTITVVNPQGQPLPDNQWTVDSQRQPGMVPFVKGKGHH